MEVAVRTLTSAAVMTLLSAGVLSGAGFAPSHSTPAMNASVILTQSAPDNTVWE